MVFLMMLFLLGHHESNRYRLLLSHIRVVLIENNIDLLLVDGVTQALSVRLGVAKVGSIPQFLLFLDFLLLNLLSKVCALQSAEVDEAIIDWVELKKHVSEHSGFSRIH